MAVIKWRDSYNTGVGKIDEEHKQLVELIETMHSVIRDGASLTKVSEVLTKLSDYTEFHFNNEEKLMEEYNFPEMETHKQEHERLKKEVEQFSTKLSEKYPDGLQDFYLFLREWLIQHILTIDKTLGKYLLNPKQ